MLKATKLGLTVAAGLLLGSMGGQKAMADFWWETDQGTLYFEGASGNWGVFKFLDDSNNIIPRIGLFIKGMGPMYTGGGVRPGTYEAQWFDYSGSDCSREAQDPTGRIAQEWGTMWFTVHEDINYFTAQVYNCDETEPATTFRGTPGQ